MRETGFGPVSERWQRPILTAVLLAPRIEKERGYIKFMKTSEQYIYKPL